VLRVYDEAGNVIETRAISRSPEGTDETTIHIDALLRRPKLGRRGFLAADQELYIQ
jgi:hypothetical protein